ncbi:MAG: hypothetical protein K2L86_03975 [Lachnospiraceae bacterium]|nr:hypothetical protein [Lachnospiraceae bacterium]
MTVLVFFLFTSAGIVVSKSSKTARLYHVIATTASVIWRAWGNDGCRHYDRIAVTVAITVTVTITCTNAIVLATAFSAETPQ